MMYEKIGNNYELFYRYDSEGKPQMILMYNFANSSWYKYNIVTNSQGDITKLISGVGNVSVTYTYDAWGKVKGAKSYIVYTSKDGKKFTKATTTTKTTVTLSKLTAGKKVYVKVVAVNAYGKNSAYSSAKSVTVK